MTADHDRRAVAEIRVQMALDSIQEARRTHRTSRSSPCRSDWDDPRVPEGRFYSRSPTSGTRSAPAPTDFGAKATSRRATDGDDRCTRSSGSVSVDLSPPSWTIGSSGFLPELHPSYGASGSCPGGFAPTECARLTGRTTRPSGCCSKRSRATGGRSTATPPGPPSRERPPVLGDPHRERTIADRPVLRLEVIPHPAPPRKARSFQADGADRHRVRGLVDPTRDLHTSRHAGGRASGESRMLPETRLERASGSVHRGRVRTGPETGAVAARRVFRVRSTRRDPASPRRSGPRDLPDLLSPPRSLGTSDLRRVRMHPGRAVGPAQQAVGLVVADDLALGRVPGEGAAELHREVGQDAATRSRCGPARCRPPACRACRSRRRKSFMWPRMAGATCCSRSFSVLSSGYCSSS